MERREKSFEIESGFDFNTECYLPGLTLVEQEQYMMELNSHTQRQWRYSMACPTDNQLSWLGSLKCGWSTVSAKYAENLKQTTSMHNEQPRKLLAKFEINRVNSMVTEIERFQKMDDLKIMTHFKRYKELQLKAKGDGISTCVLCGSMVTKKKQNWSKARESGSCHDCNNLMCTKCTRPYILRELTVKLCVLCYWQRELWKMSGAWYNGYHNAFNMTLEEVREEIEGLEKELFGDNQNIEEDDHTRERAPKRPLVAQYSIDDMALTPHPTHVGDFFQQKSALYMNRQVSLSLPALSLPEISIKEADEPTDNEVDYTNKERRRSSQLTKAYTIAVDSVSGSMSDTPPRKLSSHHVGDILRRLSGASGDGMSVRDIMFEHSQESKMPRLVARLVQYASPRSSFSGSIYNKDSGSESNQDEFSDASTSLSTSLSSSFSKNRFSLQEEPAQGNSTLVLPKHNSLSRLKKRAEDIFRTMSFSPVPSRETTPEISVIEFAMMYSRENQELRVTIIRCKDLKAADSNGLSDPYVNIFLAGGDPSTKQTTSMKTATLNPEYGEEIVYQGISESFVRRNEIMFVVYDYDLVGRDDFLGAASIPIRRVKHNVEKFCLQLTDNCPEILKSPKEDYGQALVKVAYDAPRNTLEVEVVKSVRLRPANRKKISANPYAKVTLFHKGHPETHKKTRVNYLTLNPEFDEMLQFQLDGRQISDINLKLAIVHKSRTKKRSSQICEATLDPLLFKSVQTGQPFQEWVQLLPVLYDKGMH